MSLSSFLRRATALLNLGLPVAAQAQTTVLKYPQPDTADDTADSATSAVDTPGSDAKRDKTLPTVDDVAYYNNGIGTSDAASQGVILGELLQDIPLLRPGEVLESIPGLVVTQHWGDGKTNQYFLRGYDLDHGTDFATSVDGVPVNMPTNAHGQGYTNLNFLIPELIDRIDYRKRTYFADNGDFSSVGSADIHYRDRLDSGIANFTLGSDGYRRTLLANSFALSAPAGTPVSAAGGRPILLAAIEGLNENGPWKRPEDMHKFNGLLRLSDGDERNGWSVEGIGYDARWNSTDQVPLALIESGQLCRFCALDPTDGGDSAREILSGEWHMHDGNGYIKASTYLEHYRMQLFSNFTYYELRPATGDQFEQEESRNLAGGKFAKGWFGEIFGHDSTTEAGVQVRHDNIHVGLSNTEARIPFETVDDNLVSETGLGVYVQNSTAWSHWFRSQVGLRADNVRMDVNSLTLADSSNASQSRVSPKLSLVFGPWHKTEFFVDAGNGFHSNDARGVVYKYDPTTGLPSSPVPALVGSFGKEIGCERKSSPDCRVRSRCGIWTANPS